MNLPKIKTSVYAVDLPLNGKLEYRPILMKEEMAIFSSIQFGNEDDLFVTLKNIVKDCIITENFDIMKLTLYEFFYLILLIRSKSKGEVVNLIYECDKCKSKIDFNINIVDSIIFENKEKIKVVVELGKDFGIELKPYSVDALQYLNKLAENKNDTVSFNNLICSAVNRIFYEGEIYDASKFSKEEIIENILNRLDENQFDKLYNTVEEMFYIKIKYKIECYHNKCDFKKEVETSDLMSFFI